MKNLFIILVFCTLFFKDLPAQPQITWDNHNRCFVQNGRPIFLTGVNYIPPKDWLLNLVNPDPEAIESDMKALSSAGVNCIRIYPLWSLIQPDPDRLDPEIMENMDRLIAIAGRNGMAVQISVITGLMSGGIFMPEWAGGNIFTDPGLISKEVFLVSKIAERYRDNPHVCGYDFGNEINVLQRKLNLPVSGQELGQWLQAIYSGFRKGDSVKPVTNGTGTGYDKLWNAENISMSSDFYSTHSFIDSHGTQRLDPYIGMRTTYSLNCMNAWSGMTGKPVVSQQIAIPSTVLPDEETGKLLRITMMSSWGDGDIGYLWWCSHNIDQVTRIKTDGLFPDNRLKNNNVSREDHFMGLLDEHNRDKALTGDFRNCAMLARELGSGWKNLLPVCYILVREGDEQKSAMLHYINPFVLAKQAHMVARFLPENKPVPADAGCVVIPGFRLKEMGKACINSYLRKGGIVYQSVFNDFSSRIILTGEEQLVKDPVFLVSKSEGILHKVQSIRIGGPVIVKNVQIRGRCEPVLVNSGKVENQFPGEAGSLGPVYAKVKIGNGTYFYLAADLENGLINTSDPWESDESGFIYAAFRPVSSFTIDSKNVELVYREKGMKKMIMLINHVNREEVVRIFSRNPMKLTDVLTGKPLVKEWSEPVLLHPGQVIAAYAN